VVDSCSQIIITDGVMNGTQVSPGQRPEICEPSTDGTRELAEQLAEEYDNVETFHMDGMPTPTEVDLRNIHLNMAIGKRFLILDADEVWPKGLLPHAFGMMEDRGATSAFVYNRLYFWNPNFYVLTKHKRLFEMVNGIHFTDNNHTEPNKKTVNLPDIFFHHYGYIDQAKVEAKMALYSDELHYHGCGPWWFKNVFLKFDGTLEGAMRLMETNGNTLHPWGSFEAGFAADEFTPLRDPTPVHPEAMETCFRQLGFDVSNIDFRH
jgi:hypothetical protein